MIYYNLLYICYDNLLYIYYDILYILQDKI